MVGTAIRRVPPSREQDTHATEGAVSVQLGRGAQGGVDPLLPARSIVLKMGENIPIDTQRNKLLACRDWIGLRLGCVGLGRCGLEESLSALFTTGWSTRSVGHRDHRARQK